MTSEDGVRTAAPARPGLAGAARIGDRGLGRVLRGEGEPDQAGRADVLGRTPSGTRGRCTTGGRRGGGAAVPPDPAAARGRRARLGDRAARRARRGARGGGGHRALHRELPAGVLGGGLLGGRVPGPGRAGVRRGGWRSCRGRRSRATPPHVFGIPAASRHRFSHVRLRIYPDGGVARLRVHGVVVPDPSLLEGLTFDLAALENGGDVVACSDRFYSSPRNAISPGLSRVMGEGWETAAAARSRERVAGRAVRRAGAGVAGRGRHLRLHRELAGRWPSCAGTRGPAATGRGTISSWAPLLPRTALLPDTPHRFRVSPAPCELVRLDVLPRRRRGPAAAVRIADHRGAGPGALALGADGGLRPFYASPAYGVESAMLKI